MKRRLILAAPALIATLGALPARAQAPAAAVVTEEFSVPSSDGMEVFLRSKRPEGASPSASRTLVMVHGAGFGGSTTFDLPFGGLSWMDYIAGRGFDVWSIDIRGFGRSTRPPALSQPADQNPPVARGTEALADLSAAVAFIRQRRGIGKLVLLGHGWGTELVGRFAAESADQVERLVLFAPVWLHDGPGGTDGGGTGGDPLGAWQPLTQQAVRQAILAQAPEDKRAALIPPGWFDHFAGVTWALDPDGIRARPSVLRAPTGPAADDREFWSAGRPWWDPSWVTAPALVVLGEWDRSTPPAQGFALFGQMERSPGKRMVVLAEGTHSMWMERNRGALFQAVQVFLEEAEA